MEIETTVRDARARVRALRADGARIALVPTMGALHDGHLALVDAARRSADVVVVSIFVNPLQFGPQEDFAEYPRTLEADVAALQTHEVSFVFAPGVDQMYAPGARTTVTPSPHARLFEGAVRPGHFAGVLTVVAKLFNIVQPDVAIFGRKDLQQLSLIRAMVHDLDFPVEVQHVDTIRESDGLALSSRNRRLDAADRARATILHAALHAAADAFAHGEHDPGQIEAVGRKLLATDPAVGLNYFTVVDPATFATPQVVTPGNAIVTAARIGPVRLIDNIIL